MNFKASYFNPIIVILACLLAGTSAPPWIESRASAQTDKFNNITDRTEIERIAEELDDRARTLIAEGNEEEAFAIWYRELKLQRQLGKLPEISALARVGEIAWDMRRKADLQTIDARLKEIEREASSNQELAPEILNALGQAYQRVRNVNNALEIYRQILDRARQQTNSRDISEILLSLGQLYLAKFDRTRAALTYEELLALAREKKDALNEDKYLQRLADIYTQALQIEDSARVKQELANNYLQNRQLQLLPALYISLGSDYQALDRPQAASQQYEEAFKLAWSLQQLSAASVALQKLGELYRAYKEKDLALQVYRELLKVERESYNLYGQMSAYDSIGQIQLEQKNFSQALAAFERGLEIAKLLKHREAYFLERINLLNEQMSGG